MFASLSERLGGPGRAANGVPPPSTVIPEDPLGNLNPAQHALLLQLLQNLNATQQVPLPQLLQSLTQNRTESCQEKTSNQN